MAVTYADVAKMAGTSTAVVSYVFNDGPRGVAPGTRERVLAAAAALGYRPNRLAEALRTGASGFVGVLAPDSSIPFFAELTRALVAELGRRKLFALVSHAGLSGLTELEAIDTLLSAQVDGLIVTAFWEEDHSALRPDVPLVYVHHRPPGSAGTLIPSDNTHAVALAIEHFRTEHSISSPAFWSGPTDHGPLGERARSWAGIVGSNGLLIRSEHDSSAAESEFQRMAAQGDIPRGIIVATDQQAFGILAAAYQEGIRIPEDLAIISLDGSQQSAFTAPSLTVVQQPLEKIASRAVDTLFGKKPSGISPEGHLIIRHSCGCDPG